MIYVLDGNAMIAFLRGEPGADVVRLLLRDGANTCFAHAINLCEVYYDFHRAAGGQAATAAIQDLINAGFIAREDLDSAFWQTRLRELNRDQAYFEQLEWRIGHAAMDAVKRYLDSIVLPSLRRAAGAT